jgi:hypothetical protein
MNDYANDPDFERILNLQPSDIERPQPLPKGLYLATIKDNYEFVKSSQKGTPGVKFIFTIIGVIDGVDQAELAKTGGYQGKTVQHTFWLPAEDLDSNKGRMDWRLHEFLDHCGVPTGVMSERLENVFGAQVGIDLGYRPNQTNPDIKYLDVRRTFNPAKHEDDTRLPLNNVPKAPARAGRR